MKLTIASIFLLVLFASPLFAQRLPKTLKSYLDQNYSGWKLAGECYEKDNKRILVGDFDGNRKRDYALKFVRGEKGFFMAFLSIGKRFKPFYLHIYSPDEAKHSDLMLFSKGEQYELGEANFRLKFDAPADFRCESDVGGVHAYRAGKFIAY